jgi:hypothetical protein
MRMYMAEGADLADAAGPAHRGRRDVVAAGCLDVVVEGARGLWRECCGSRFRIRSPRRR